MMERHAKRLRQMASELDAIARDFDNSGKVCECCEAVRYNNFPQKQFRDRLDGAVVRLTEMSDLLIRRKNDQMFLTGREA